MTNLSSYGEASDISVPAYQRGFQTLEVRFRGGMLHVLRQPRIADKEDLPLTKGFDEREDASFDDL